MIMHLMEALIPEKEIEKRARKLNASGLILPQNWMAGPREEPILTAKENEQLNLVIRMMGRSFASLHVNMHLMGINAPLLSLYMHSTHLFALFFRKQGVQVAELLSPGDIAPVLTQCIVTMPSVRGARTVQTGLKTVEETVAAIEQGSINNTENVLNALEKQTSIGFWLTGLVGDRHALLVNLGEEACSLIEGPEDVSMIFGSPIHSVSAVNDWALEAFSLCVKSFNQAFGDEPSPEQDV